MAEKRVRVTQIKSGIGRTKRHNATLEALGLGRIGKSQEHPVNGALLGMVRQVHALVKIEEI